jgi:hypothetical protein
VKGVRSAENLLTWCLQLTLNQIILNVMKLNGSVRILINSSLGSVFVFSLILFSSVSCSQSPVNFSGVWIQDTAKSDDFYKAFIVKYTIAQTPQTFTVKQAFSDNNGQEIVARDYTFTLDGKVTTMEKEGGTEKELAQWSADKKTLTTRSTVTYGNEDVGFTETYSISDNGLVLTILKADIIPGALSVKMVLNKQK